MVELAGSNMVYCRVDGTMIVIKALTEQQIIDAATQGELATELRNAAECVTLIATQSWCHQWVAMKHYLSKPSIQTDLSIVCYYFEYDLSDQFDTIRTAKESQWDNHEIPYIRYYKHGNLITATNFIPEPVFFDTFK